MKTLAVIIPRYVHNPEVNALTERTIDKLVEHADHRFAQTITVVDNGSTIPWQERSNVDYYRWEENKGIAPAWNHGWRMNPRADFYCWLNADCEVTPGWSYPLVVVAEQMPVISMPYTNGEKNDGVGITGWCFLTSRETADKIGPFDEAFVPAQYEDTDWFHRAIYQHRIALVNLPTSNVLHERKKGGTKNLPNFETRWQYLHMANRMRYAWKWGVDPNDTPPFWKSPLPDVEIEDNNASQLQVSPDSNER